MKIKSKNLLDLFDAINLIDFEFLCNPGEIPIPHCLVVIDARTGKVSRFFAPFGDKPPFSIGRNDLVCAYYVSAEMSCHLALGWDLPENILDLYVEFRTLTNAGSQRIASSLLDALAFFKLPSIATGEKKEMRELAMSGGPFSEKEKEDLLDYCESDVVALKKLLEAMKDTIDIERALLRGRYMIAVAQMEHNGIPLDLDLLNRFKTYWSDIQRALIYDVNKDYGVFDGTTFRQSAFQDYLRRQGIAWPKLPSGKLDLKEETFKMMAASNPQIESLYELRSTLSKMKTLRIPAGKDGRNRCLLSPFSSKTSRNQPSTAQFIFGLSAWLRSLMKPEFGFILAYLDWCQQEFGIAAALSGDTRMMEAYLSGDPYLTFGKQAGVIPENGTKESHKAERSRFKIAALAVQYGMGPLSLGVQLGQSESHGRELLTLHKKTYPQYWDWIDRTVSGAKFEKSISTVFGWKMKVDKTTGSRTIANFPCQANGAEMLRIAISLAVQNGVKVCAPVHDALLIEAKEEEAEEQIRIAQDCMRKASSYVLDGFELRSDCEIIRYPNRYSDERDEQLWTKAISVLGELERKGA